MCEVIIGARQALEPKGGLKFGGLRGGDHWEEGLEPPGLDRLKSARWKLVWKGPCQCHGTGRDTVVGLRSLRRCLLPVFGPCGLELG